MLAKVKNHFLYLWAFGMMLFFTACSNQTSNQTKKQASAFKKAIQEALNVRQKAYAPYSNYLVGSALVTPSNKTYLGCNIENASYGATNCAERSALFTAVSSGDREFSMLVVASKDGKAFPCGICRQALNEFSPDMLIILINEKGKITQKIKLSRLLPNAFGPHNLK